MVDLFGKKLLDGKAPERVGHGWVCAYHFETRTIKVFLSLWDKHAIMPPIRIAVCFDGRIIIHDHIPTNTLRALSHLPHVSNTVCFVLCAFLFTVRRSIHLHTLFFIPFLTAQTRSLCFTPTITPCDTHSFHVYLRFPLPYNSLHCTEI